MYVCIACQRLADLQSFIPSLSKLDLAIRSAAGHHPAPPHPSETGVSAPEFPPESNLKQGAKKLSRNVELICKPASQLLINQLVSPPPFSPPLSPLPKMPTKMAIDRSGFNEDVWLHIVKYLHRASPAPLSRPSRTDRSVLGQPDLAVIRRVSRVGPSYFVQLVLGSILYLQHQLIGQALRDVATPLMYKTVTTDDFPSLIRNANPSSVHSSSAYQTPLY
jgi:hypothetical protein